MLFKRVLSALCIGFTAFVNMANADQESFDTAVDVYMKGFKECVDAHASRGESIVVAKRKYKAYLDFKAQAVAIDKSILTSNQRSLQKNQRYCEKAYDNILRAEAEPIMQKGISACEQAKATFETGSLEEAKIKIDLFEQQHTEALSITDNILDIYSIASKVRSCNRLKQKIVAAAEGFQIQEEESQLVIGQLIDANEQCEIGHNLASKVGVKLSDIDVIQRSLNKSRAQIKTAKKYTTAMSAMADFPDRDSSKQMSLLFAKASACTQSVSAALNKTRAKKTNAEKSINEASIAAKKSYDNCLAGESLVQGELFQYKNLDEALRYLNESKKLQQTAKALPGALLAAKNPKWATSKKFRALIDRTKACENAIATQHKLRKAEYAQKNDQLQQEKAETQRKLLAEQRKLDEEKAKLLEEQRAEEAAEIAQKAAQEAQAIAEAQERTVAEQEDAGSAAAYTRPNIRRSWTNLINNSSEEIFIDEGLDEDLDEDLDEGLDEDLDDL